MPKTATKRIEREKKDKYWNEKQLARDFFGGLNDVVGRGGIAGLVGAPGDIANMAENGLRALIGKPQVSAWGGSEHIGQKLQDAGLVSDVRRPKTELLASLISPSAAAKTILNAPKTARNALRMLDNLEAPSTMRNMSQRGAIDVWHGSPHKFDTFKAMDNIGGGEGAQAYGHGGYHASDRSVAKGYGDNLTDFNTNKPVVRDYSSMITQDVGNSVSAIVDSRKKTIARLESVLANTPDTPENAMARKVATDQINRAKATIAEAETKGNLYRNQLRWPDPAREAADPLSDKHFLDWDKPLSEQDASVQEILGKISLNGSPITAEKWGAQTGEQIYKNVMQGHGLQDYAAREGLPGIRYLDGGSRSAGQGSHNYVTFDDALVNILERNGQPVTAPQPGLLGKMVAPQDEALRVAQANAAKPVSEGGLGLRLDNTPEERAAAMGFDIDNPMAHGTGKNIKKFKVGKGGYDEIGSGVYAAPIDQGPYGYTRSNAWAQGEGGINYPLVVKNDLADYDRVKSTLAMPNHKLSSGEAISPPNDVESELIQRIISNDPQWLGNEDLLRDQIRVMGVENAIKKAGYAGSKSADSQVPNQVVTFDPRNIRSRFAAFDPMRRDSSDLLAGVAPLGLGALIAQPKEKKKP